MPTEPIQSEEQFGQGSVSAGDPPEEKPAEKKPEPATADPTDPPTPPGGPPDPKG